MVTQKAFERHIISTKSIVRIQVSTPGSKVYLFGDTGWSSRVLRPRARRDEVKQQQPPSDLHLWRQPVFSLDGRVVVIV